MKEGGSVSVQTLLIIAGVSIIGLVVLLSLQDSVTRVAKYEDRVAVRQEVLSALTEVLRAMEEDETPEGDSFHDQCFTTVQEISYAFRVEIRDLSSRINPNWVRKQLFQRTSMGSLLRNGISADALQQFREDHGFSPNIDNFYAEFFKDVAFHRYLTGYSFANINTSDEFALRKLYARLTGDTAAAEVFHTRVQNLLQSRELLTEEELPTFLSPYPEELLPVMTTLPQWNVNFLDPFLLEAILSYPAFGIPSPSDKAASLVVERDGSEITPVRLVELCGVDPSHPLFSYLGTQTFFWEVQGVNAEGEQVFSAILARDLLYRERKIFRLVEIVWPD
ncbi:hypothetical protein Spith_1575 [Spirochaeta thermophila DSM 6578]|uniref:Type II secretion system protein K n=1 Tax=Winmispira thermophila (strain ATCC 700085 / DSM 6578 / Z-1203) TaxID=869211 RepID=G0GAU0_WINT7|nr:hypothetical protein Spith_1575 [Spirochaeta thermophila DSM 6578]